MKSVFAHLLAGSWLFVLTTAAALQTSNEQLIKRLEGAAPSDIVANATIVNVAADGKMSTVREGTNGWTCMDPDPGGSPMCGDAGGTNWIHAYMSKGAFMIRDQRGSRPVSRRLRHSSSHCRMAAWCHRLGLSA